jgi:hypothetical protein
VRSIEDAVKAYFARWAGGGVGAIDRDVLGTDSPAEIGHLFERFCTERLGARPEGALFYIASAGCVLGVRLESGDEVVIKAYQKRWSSSLLSAVQKAQELVADGGIPCARPRLGPTRFATDRPNLAVVETWIADPGLYPGRSAREREVSARGLALQIALCLDMNGAEALDRHPLRTPDEQLYPEPHSPLFDFEATAAGAGWIDEAARWALSAREQDESTAVVAHTDWSARNVRFDEERLLAVYDWDSLALVRESTALGQAAMTWSVTADPGGTEFPKSDDVLAYLDDYQRARSRPLSSDQRRAARAAALYTLAYAARCEHSLDVRGIARPDQVAARKRLEQARRELLEH